MTARFVAMEPHAAPYPGPGKPATYGMAASDGPYAEPAQPLPEIAALAPPAPRPSTAADLWALTKPRITLMIVVTMTVGIWLAAKHGHPQALRGTGTLLRLATAVAGTALVVSSANALNMYLERSTDGLMTRTRNRPLPTGRLSAEVALAFGLLLGGVSVPLLTFAVNPMTGLLAAVALVSYVLVYTPLKRRSTLSLLVGAVPGAMPPLLGWAAVTGKVEWPGILLFGIMFLWQIPHFLAIATFRCEEYARAGLKVLPVVRGDRVTRRHIVVYLVALLAVSFALVTTGVGGSLYLAAAVVLGVGFLGAGLWGLRADAGVRWARVLFAVSLVYQVLLFAALVVSPC